MPPQSEEDALLARLNSLKPSTVTFKRTLDPYSSVTTANEDDPKDNEDAEDLNTRFLNLHGNRQASKKTASYPKDLDEIDFSFGEENGQSLDELIEELEGDQEWKVSVDEEQESMKLLAEAQSALVKSRSEDIANLDAQKSSEVEGSNAQDGHSEREEAREYIRKVLEKTSLDDQEEEAERDKKEEDDDTEDTDKHDSLPVLPSAPREVPIKPKENTKETVLPDAPKFKPLATRSQSRDVERFADEDIDTWCIICNDDANVRCLGCDGDLYCASCWEEGHRGDDAGYEEKSHRAVRFVKKAPDLKRKKKILAV